MVDTVAALVEELSGLACTGHRRRVLAGAVEERAGETAGGSLQRYRALLQESPGERSALLERLTVNETSFFRNSAQFSFLAGHIVPELEGKGRDLPTLTAGVAPPPFPLERRKLRVLSAGCSTGEEPYSVAMTLAAALRYPGAWDVEIVAGDISERCLASCAAAFFETDRLKGIPEEYAERYLEKRPGGAVIREEIRRLVRFAPLNLAELMEGRILPGEPWGEPFDLVLCRNVMIYFSLATQQRLVDTLFSLLKPGGYLFTGDAEPLHLFHHHFKPVAEAGCLVYRRPEVAPHA